MKRLILLGTVLVLMATLVEAQQRGVTRDKITCGAWIAMSGPLAYPGVGHMNGAGAYLDFVNEQGGIYGRKIEYITYNDDYSPPKSVAIARKLIEKDKIFFVLEPMGTGPCVAALPVTTEAKVPVINPGTGSTKLLKPFNRYVFACRLNYENQMGLMVDYLVKEKKMKKIALFAAKGEIAEITKRGTVDRLRKYGLDLVAYDDAMPEDVDVSAQLNKFKAADAEALMITATPKPASLILNMIKNSDWRPILFLYGAITEQVPKMAKEAAEGVYAMHWIPPVDSEYSGIAEHKAQMAKYRPKAEVNEYTLYGYVGAKTVVEFLKRAGKDLDVETFIKAGETLRDWDTGVGIKLTFTPTDHDGNRYGGISQYREGKFHFVTGWIKSE